MPPRKPPRRKPPPDFGDLLSDLVSAPILPLTFLGGSDNSNTERARIDTAFSRKPDYPIDTSRVLLLDVDDSFDDLVLWESPKPMGPKELPEFDGLETSDNDVFEMHNHQSPLPYPIDDSRLTGIQELPADNFSRTTQIIADSLNTPTKIPELNVLDSLQRPYHDYSLESTPSRTMKIHNRTITPQSSSQTLGSSTTPRFDRSPSPNKTYARSPSLLYKYGDSFPTNEGPAMAVWDDQLAEDSEELTLHDRTSAWSSVETDGFGNPIQEYYYDDEFDDLYDMPETPATNYFDYSILPDLPTPSHSPSSSPSFRRLPQRQPLLKKDSQPSISRKRMDEDLPPVPLDLPKLPFSAATLVAQHLSQCTEVWSMSKIYQWCLRLNTWLHDEFMSRKEFKKALIKLLVYNRRNTPLDIIGRNVDQIISNMLATGAASIKQDEPVSDVNNLGITIHPHVAIGGVLIDLTPCYCRDNDHTKQAPSKHSPRLRCYSSQCHFNNIIAQETLMKNTKLEDIVLGVDWASHWKLTADNLRALDKSTAKRQSLIYDLLRYEQTFIMRGLCFVDIVAPEFLKAARVLLGTNRSLVDKFEEQVIAPGREVVKHHQEILFRPLLRILIAEGRFIKSVEEIAAIYSQWSKQVRKSLLQYMSAVPMIEDLMRYDTIKRWVDVEVRKLPRVQELQVNGPLLFISTFNSRYQQLPLQLGDIRLLYDPEDLEFQALTQVIESVKALGSNINDMKIHADNIHALKRLQYELVWKKDVRQVNINLGSENRRLLRRGDILRRGDLKLNTSTSHLILLDNYLFITERTTLKTGVKYKVSEAPIPIEVLLLEVKDRVPLELRGRRNSPVQGTIMGASPNHEPEDEPSTHSFKVRFAGRKYSTFTFMARSENERQSWIDSFTQAKSNLCKRLSRSAPYNLEPIDISSFRYETGKAVTKLQECVAFDPLYEMSRDSVSVINDQGSANTFTGQVQCFTRFRLGNDTFHLAGLSSGLYCANEKSCWKRIAYDDVTNVACIPELRIVLVLANKVLKYYSLDLVLAVYHELSSSLPSVLLSNDSVQFFEVGKHRSMMMLFYAKKKNSSTGSTNFKAVIPEVDNDGVFHGFKVLKKFYVQAECYALSVFNTSLAVHTSKGIEILELDKLQPRSVPDLPVTEQRKIDGYSRLLPNSGLNASVNAASTNMEIIRKHITSSSSKPMGMFKLANNAEFLLVYSDGAVFTNKHGKLSRPGMLQFDFKAKSVSFADNNLFLATSEVIEVWSISDFVQGTNRLIQVVTGKDVRMVGTQSETIFAVANPAMLGSQLVFSLTARGDTFG